MTLEVNTNNLVYTVTPFYITIDIHIQISEDLNGAQALLRVVLQIPLGLYGPPAENVMDSPIIQGNFERGKITHHKGCGLYTFKSWYF